MEVMTAQIEQIKEQNQRASATQIGFSIFVQDMVAKVAPAQKEACAVVSLDECDNGR
jgi:hypothetical protein